MGLAYKENVADIRESPARWIVDGLVEFGARGLWAGYIAW
jgi:UDP-N-acetyl-D-mannosaminuronate dehydrogenase